MTYIMGDIIIDLRQNIVDLMLIQRSYGMSHTTESILYDPSKRGYKLDRS